MKVTGSLKSLIQGVSQQPDIMRLPGQCTEQINCSSDPVNGLVRRACTTEVANLFTSSTPAQFYDMLVNNTRYLVVSTIGSLQVFDATTGESKTVNENNSSFAYLDGNPLAFTTSDDITYVGNRSKVCLMKSLSQTYFNGVGLINVIGGDYGKTYTVNIVWSGGTITESYTTPNGAVATDITAISTTAIATSILGLLNGNGTFTSNFSASQSGNVVQVVRNTNARFTMSSADGVSGTNMIVITDSLQDASKLPQFASQGHVVQITGSGQNGATDAWYAMFNVNKDQAGNPYSLGTGFGNQGVWEEVVAPAINFEILSTTMPHILTYDANTDEFTFDLAGFANRAAGDYVTNPDPSFIGSTIEDISFFQGRLVFLSGENCIMSRTNKPFDFWKNSATTLADSDPIDVKSTAKGVKKLFRAIPFNRDLIVYSNIGQFIFFGRNAVTPQNSAMVLTTTFEANMAATPIPAGRNIFFAIQYGTFTGIREFYADSTLDVNDSRPITQNITKYLAGNPTLLSSSKNFDLLLVHTDSDLKTVYPYEYIWIEERKVQSSWSKWVFPQDVVYSCVNQSLVTFVMKQGNDYILSVMDLDIQPDNDLTYQVKLDRKKLHTGVHTTIANPYSTMPVDPTTITFVQSTGCPNPGLVINVSGYNAGTNTFTFPRDMNGGTVISGIKYRSSYIPTLPHVTDRDGANVGVGKLKITKFLLNYVKTGCINGRVISPYRPDQDVRFIGRVVGDINSSVGNPALVDGKLYIPFRSDIAYSYLEIWTDDVTPMTLIEIEWKGQYTVKGQRITNNKSMGGQY